MKKTTLAKTTSAIAIVSGSLSLCASSALIHRYSFSNAAGDATAGVLADSVGGANGAVLGAGATFTGTGLNLPGGASATAAYADLPNNLISVHTAVTIEGWVTVDATGHSWARVFDIGSNQGGAGGEITGPGDTNGGGGDSGDTFLLSAASATDYDTQRLQLRNLDPGAGGETGFNSSSATTAGTQFHFAVSWEDTGAGTSQVNYWRDGVQLTTDGVVPFNLSELNDVNVWLGRSNWVGDANLDGTFNELRIHDNVVDQAYVDASIIAGPDNLVPEPSAFGLAGLAGMMLLFRRRR